MPSTPAVSTAINSPAWTACARHHCARQHCHQSGSKSVHNYYHARRRLAWPPNLRQVNHPARAACRVGGQCSRAGCQHLESLLSSVAGRRPIDGADIGAVGRLHSLRAEGTGGRQWQPQAQFRRAPPPHGMWHACWSRLGGIPSSWARACSFSCTCAVRVTKP